LARKLSRPIALQLKAILRLVVRPKSLKWSKLTAPASVILWMKPGSSTSQAKFPEAIDVAFASGELNLHHLPKSRESFFRSTGASH
jgi:hypothetical protein